MKIKIVLLAVCLLAFGSINFAQTKKTAAASAPEQVVKNLYAARKNPRTDPFFQTKSRALVDKYFTKELADLIWKDALCQKKTGGICKLDFNVLYATNGGGAEDASAFKIGKPEYGEGNRQLADIPVTFKLFATKDNAVAETTILFRLEQNAKRIWKISDIYYPNSEFESSNSLKKILTATTAE